MRLIAGRAGRHGQYDTGYVTVLEDVEQWHLHYMLATDDRVDLPALPMSISGEDIQTLSARLNTWRIAECVAYWQHQYAAQQTALLSWQTSNMQHQQALLIDQVAPNLAMMDKYRLLCAPLALQVPIARDYFVLCIQSINTQTPRGLPALPKWVGGQQAQYLEQAEHLLQQLSLYSWLSYQCPGVFNQRDLLPQARQRLNAFISRALLVQSGYGKTQHEQELSIVR